MSSNGDVQADVQPVPGMPRYTVTGSSEGDREFASYGEARRWKHAYGGKLRAL